MAISHTKTIGMKKIALIPFAIILCAPAFSQNVGIGTTSPAAKLDVKTTSNYVGQFNGASPMYMSIFEGDVYRGYWGSYAGAAEDVDFGTGAGNTTGKLHLTIQAVPKLTIGSNGKVGIGTTNPAHLLHINGGDLFVQSSHGVIRLGYAGGNEWQMATTGGGADLRWYTTANGGSTVAPRHYFSQNGNVGIGGFSGAGVPNARLEVIGSGNTSATNLLMLRRANGDTLVRVRDDGRFHVSGAMLIGSTSARTALGYALSVDGKIMAEDVVIQNSTTWPDYVFEDNYKLLSLEELDKRIKQQKHLPNIPSTAELAAQKSVSLGEMDRKLLEKVEELTLYIIQLDKDKKELEKRVTRLENSKD